MTYAAKIAALPCPLCGSAKVEGDFGDDSACYRCRDCGCQSGRVYFTAAEREADDFTSSEEFALAAWNRRAASAELSQMRERVAELERALGDLLASDRADQSAIVGRDVDGHPVNAAGLARIQARAALNKESA